MSERRGTKALELWCKRMTEGYPGVKVENMTTSWRDGLAFCAIIHHFRPELIDFSKLNKEDVFHNNDLAFTVAEKYLGIPALLEPEDMVEYDVPDRLSILTYLSQFYRTFVAAQGSSPARIVPKRPANSSDRGSIGSPASTSPPAKMAIRSGGGGIPRREPCAKCGNPVYIAERLTVGKALYHRTCFRCARCNSQLTLANYYETETANQFCCETCPDEEPSKAHVGDARSNKGKTEEKSVLSRSLSDEEKSAGLKNLSYQQFQQQQDDEYSAKFETALEESSILGSPMSESSEFSRARTQFLTANLIDSTSDTEIPPELPKTKPPDIKSANTSPTFSSAERHGQVNTLSGNSVNKTQTESKDNSGSLYLSSRSSNLHPKTSSANNSKNSEKNKTSFSSVNQLSTVSSVAKSKHNVTKDKTQPQNGSNVPKEDEAASLVKNRMRMFEKSDIKEVKSPQEERRPHVENLKRPLTDTTVTSPEKKFSLEKPAFLKPTSSPADNKSRAALEIADASVKSNREIAQSQAKSLTFLLQKQIALKEGKISPKAVINQAKAESADKAKSAENITLNNETNLAKDRLPVGRENQEKQKSLENLLIKPRAHPVKPAIVERKHFPAQSPSSNRRDSTEENKNKPFAMRKIETPSEKIWNSNRNAKSGNQSPRISLGKISPDRGRPTSLNVTKPDISTNSISHRLKKQQSMEDIPKTSPETNRVSLSRHWKDGRKENVFQNKYKSAEKLAETSSNRKTTASDNDGKKKTFANYTPIAKRISAESLSKSVPLRHPGKLHNSVTASTGSMGKLDYSEYRRARSRMNMYVSDTELNNILNRSNNADWSTSSYRKSMDYLPMRSIENIYRSNSEENLGYRSENRPAQRQQQQQQQQQHEPAARNSVSALKSKFECLSVVESRPTSCQSDQTAPPDNTDTRINSVVSEIQPEKPHGEILRDGHIITAASKSTGKMEGRGRIASRDTAESASLHRSDADDSSEVVIAIDLTESDSPKHEDDDLSSSRNEVVTISDDSVIEISDSGISEKFDASGLSEGEKKPADGEYPEDLNPFGDEVEDNRKLTNPNDSLNPFGDDEDEDNGFTVEDQQELTRPVRSKVIISLDHEGDTPEYRSNVKAQRISVNPFEDKEEDNSTNKPTPAVRRKLIIPREEENKKENEKNSTNPFDDDEDEEDDGEFGTKGAERHPVHSSLPQKKLIHAPNISLNPFWSDADEDEPEYDEDDYENKEKPVPKPRKSRNATGSGTLPEPKPRTSNQLAAAVAFGSNSSLSSSQSGGQSVRKKKPAPRPPIIVSEAKTESPPESSLTSSPSTSVSHSPKLATKARKAKKAPLPPTSTPLVTRNKTIFSEDISPIPGTVKSVHLEVEDGKAAIDHEEEWDNGKDAKDKDNENRRSQLYSLPASLPLPDSNEYQEYIPNKSTYGKWKRKKGPAPSRPVPQMRTIKALPVSEFRKELDLIELQKQGLEKQGVRLERIIRDRCEGPDRDESIVDGDDTVPIEVEDLILQLFEVVNEKNELSRREAELMYLQRQQRLEEEHAEVEYQIRCLMMQPEVNKTDSDKTKEEELIQRLVEIVERRNEIIECLEMDRLREAEEDDSISTSLNSYASRRDEQSAGANPGHVPKTAEEEQEKQAEVGEKKSKKTKKDKKTKSKKSQVVDADKDVDESETSIVSVKEKKKKKFTLF